MPTMRFAQAIDHALAQVMAEDDRIVILGEDVHAIRRELLVRFGERRVRSTPISESAFLGAAVTAAMGGLRPVVEVMLVDFLGVAMDALLNHAAKVAALSGGRWNAPLVVRTSCGGGYGDGGQHEQSLWGWLAHIPGLAVVVPSCPADAGGLMLAAINHAGPVIFLEHKLLAENWLAWMGVGGRRGLRIDVPAAGARGSVPSRWKALPVGKAAILRRGEDVTLVSLGVGVHRAIEASKALRRRGISAEVIDLRWVAPLDVETVRASVRNTGRLLVIDEDYECCGLSGELAALMLEAGMGLRYARVCTRSTIPYARHLEDQVLPSVGRILDAAQTLLA